MKGENGEIQQVWGRGFAGSYMPRLKFSAIWLSITMCVFSPKKFVPAHMIERSMRHRRSPLTRGEFRTLIHKVPNFFAKDPISKNLTCKLLACWFMCARLWLGVLCWHAHNTRFVSVRFLLVILSYSLSSCLCLSPSGSVLVYTFLLCWMSFPVLIRSYLSQFGACSWMFHGLSSCPPRLLDFTY